MTERVARSRTCGIIALLSIVSIRTPLTPVSLCDRGRVGKLDGR